MQTGKAKTSPDEMKNHQCLDRLLNLWYNVHSIQKTVIVRQSAVYASLPRGLRPRSTFGGIPAVSNVRRRHNVCGKTSKAFRYF